MPLVYAECPTRDDIIHAIMKLKDGKATKDEIIPEALKWGGEQLHEEICDLIEEIWEEERIPEEWGEALQIPSI